MMNASDGDALDDAAAVASATAAAAEEEDDRTAAAAVDLREFLDFLISAYRCDNALLRPAPSSDAERSSDKSDRVDWTELSHNELFGRLAAADDPRNGRAERARRVLGMKLKDVVNEGVLDSVLPFIVRKSPQPPVAANASRTAAADRGGYVRPQIKCGNGNRPLDHGTRSKGDTEIEINVCDAVQKVKKIFRCPKRLLISKMGYFSEVTKGQRLEDIDISVHCEIPIFDWLIKWVKKDLKPKNEWPTLDNGNVIPILVSASFLQMEPLFQECLAFCKSNIDGVLSSPASFGCVNDGVITRLSYQFNNGDVENMVDVKDKLKSRLFAKLIWDLCKRDPNRELGHYGTLAYAYYCCRCHMILVPSVAGKIPCKPPTFKIAQNGSVIACHFRDPKWNLNDHVKSLFTKHKCWRTVYWSLWSECHFMRCSRCRHAYPIKNQKWCQFHTQLPQYYPVENNRYVYYPVGRYPCCGERAFKFEPIKNPFGCHHREHVPLLEHTSEIETYKVMQKFPSLIAVEPPMFFSNGFSKILDAHAAGDSSKCNEHQNCTSWTGESHRFAPFIVSSAEGPSSRKSQFWWDNIVLGASSNKRSLLTELWEKPFAKSPGSPAKSKGENVYETTAEALPPNEIHSSFGSSFEEVEDSLSSFTDSDSSPSENTTSNNNRQHKTKRFSKAIRTLKQRYRYSGTYQWSSTAPMRCNQDNQREYEERCFRQIAQHVYRQNGDCQAERSSRTLLSAENPADPRGQRSDGYYVKIESELLSRLDPKNGQRPSTVDARGGHPKSKPKKTPKSIS